MKFQEWWETITALPDNERAEYISAIETLKGWDTFNKEFEWTRIFELGKMLKNF